MIMLKETRKVLGFFAKSSEGRTGVRQELLKGTMKNRQVNVRTSVWPCFYLNPLLTSLA